MQCLVEHINNLSKILITRGVDWGIPHPPPPAGNTKLKGLFWCLSTRKGFNHLKKTYTKSQQQIKTKTAERIFHHRGYLHNIHLEVSNGPWDLDFHPCLTFTVLPRLYCWQVTCVLEQDSVNYNAKAGSCPRGVCVCVLLEHSYAHLFMCCLSQLLHPNGRVGELQQRPGGPQSLKHWLSGTLQKACQSSV